MVLTKQEAVAALQNEVRILLHLAGKIDRNKLDYRPTPKQRSTMELLQYLSVMGPNLVRALKAGAFDVPAWQKASDEAKAMNFDQVLGAIERQPAMYAELQSWYRHEAGFFAGRGTAKAPREDTIAVDLADVARAIDSIWTR